LLGPKSPCFAREYLVLSIVARTDSSERRAPLKINDDFFLILSFGVVGGFMIFLGHKFLCWMILGVLGKWIPKAILASAAIPLLLGVLMLAVSGVFTEKESLLDWSVGIAIGYTSSFLAVAYIAAPDLLIDPNPIIIVFFGSGLCCSIGNLGREKFWYWYHW